MRGKAQSIAQGCVALCLALAMLGCEKATFRNVRDAGAAKQSNARRAATPQDHTTWEHHFLWGLLLGSEIDVRDYCPAGITRLRTYVDGFTLPLTIVTLGLYTPRRVHLVCATSPQKGGPR